MNKKKLAFTLLLSSMSVAVVASESTAAETSAAVPVTTPAAETPAAPKAEDKASEESKVEDKKNLSAETPAADGYFAAAWSAVKSNRVATAVLVTSSILVGAAIHAAVSSNNEVEADDAE